MRRLFLLRWVCPLSLVITCLVGSTSSLAAHSQPSLHLYRKVIPALKNVRIPLELPMNLTKSRDRFYANVVTSSAAGYEVTIDYQADCYGTTACNYGDVWGQKITMSAQMIDSGNGIPGHGRLQGKRVKIAGTLYGYYTPFGCGASCGDANLTWDKHGIRYSVGVHGGDERELLSMARSMTVLRAN